jgi:hypothetical protein
MPTTLDFLIRESESGYREMAEAYLTSHALADFRKDPLLYHKKQLGLVKDQDRPAFLVGRAAHTLILEGRDVFEAEYAVGGPVNPKTGEYYGSRTKAYQEWAEAQGKPALTDEQMQLITNLHDSVHAHGNAKELLAEGVPEGVVRAEYCGLPCQTRMDWVNPSKGIVDLKTCDNLDWLQMDARTYGYSNQLAFYRSVFAVVAGVVPDVFMIAVEKREPYRCGVWRMDPDVLAHAQRENEDAIARLVRCRELDEWPTGYEEIRVFDLM